MKKLQGTKTEQNLLTAFAGESQATNKYTYYASAAKKEGYVEIANIFTETAGNEREHAKVWFKLLHNGKVPSTLENLKDAAKGENYEHTQMYAQFAKEAKKEGFNDIARLFELVGKVEKRHEERYLKFAKKVKDKKVFNSPKARLWICLNCGTVISSKTAPIKCPTCSHPQSYFAPYREEE